MIQALVIPLASPPSLTVDHHQTVDQEVGEALAKLVQSRIIKSKTGSGFQCLECCQQMRDAYNTFTHLNKHLDQDLGQKLKEIVSSNTYISPDRTQSSCFICRRFFRNPNCMKIHFIAKHFDLNLNRLIH